jgi:hypothetical protein
MSKNFLFLILILSISVSAQNLSNLDNKYGINIFKLGSPINNYAKDCTFETNDNNGVKYYTYNKWYAIKILGFSATNDVHLGFYNDKLYTISIDLAIFDQIEFDQFQKKLEELFGHSIPAKRDPMYDDRYFWKTYKTFLGLEKYSCSSSYKPCKTSIYILSNIIDEQIKSAGF